MFPGPTTKSGRWEVPDRRGFTALINSAFFRYLCAQEKNGELSNGDLVCGICRQIHERSCFTDVEATRVSEVRICIGAQGVFNLCQHFRVTYAGLKIHPVDAVCNSRHDNLSGFPGNAVHDGGARDRNGADFSMSRVRLMQVRGRGTEDGEVKSCAELRLFQLGSGSGAVLEKNLTKGMVLEAVEKTGWSLCPHLHARSGASWLSFLLQGVEAPRKIPGSWFSSKEEPSVWPTHRCSAPNCDTQFSLTKEKVSTVKRVISREYLVMKVERCLGRMGGADDKKWMAQIVEASKLDDDKFS